MNFESIGEIADRVDNLIAAEGIPMPEAIAKQARTQALTGVRDELRSLYIELTGDDPWSTENA
ncbi:hypothetical protein [Pandoraea apista]|uniref:Uncharacterized protein n=1 Tax=Pandoraea apista TaxID=93218 RepID=A0A5E5P309_9BURK|nr:hypothetical protein [Pandoraea apista]OXS89588.1 hypothetical protein B7H01_20085 [Pandoraea apista]VVG70655.1 hypothetical protein PAP18089_01619 [Pandoraea apista]